jgi:CPA2 family monovalent cation:H+ antiporter-2
VGGFALLMYVVGRRVIPWLLERVAREGSRELFTLGVLTVALGIAVGAAALFDVSFALGAFLAGVVISESELSHQAAAEALPLQDAFAVLFFVSAGMLVDPRVFVARPLELLALTAVVVCWKPLVASTVARVLGAPARVALPLAGSLAQIGEFSFVLSGLGVSLGLIPVADRQLLLAAALVAITLNPVVVRALAAAGDRAAQRDYVRPDAPGEAPPEPAPGLAGHAVLVGFGRVGATVGAALAALGIPVVVAERDRRAGDAARALGLHVVYGDAARAGVLAATGVARAGLLVIAAPEAFHVRQIVRATRALHPALPIVVRTHGAGEQARLERLGVRRAMLGERELAYAMAHEAAMALGRGDDEADAVVARVRRMDGGGG